MMKYGSLIFLICLITCAQIKTYAQNDRINLEIENKTRGVGLEISPDGNYFLTRGPQGATYLWSMNSGKKINEFFHFDYYNDQESYALFGSNSDEIWLFRVKDYEEVKVDIWDIKSGKKTDESTLSGIYTVSDVAFNSEGNIFAISNGWGRIFIIKTKNLKTLKTISIEDLEIEVNNIEFSADNKHLIFGSYSEIYSTLLKEKSSCYSIHENWDLINWFVHNDKVIALSSETDSINNSKKYLTKLSYGEPGKILGKELIELDKDYSPRYSSINGDNLIVFCERWEGEDLLAFAFLFDYQTCKVIKKIPLGFVQGGFKSYAHNSGDFILLDSSDQIHILNPESLKAKTVINDRPSDLIAKFHPNKEHFFTLEEGILNSWYIKNGEHFITHSVAKDSIKIIDFFINPLNGNLVFNSNSSIYYSSFPEGKLIQKTRLNTQKINQIQCSNSGNFFIVSYDSIMQFYNSNGALINDFIVKNRGDIKNFLISPNDKIIALQTDSSISLYDIESNNLREIKKLESYPNETIKSFNPSSRILVIEKFGSPMNYFFLDTENIAYLDSVEVYGSLGGDNFLFSADESSFCTDNGNVFSILSDFSSEDYRTENEKVCFGTGYSSEEERIDNCYVGNWTKYGYPIRYSSNGEHIYFQFANLIESRHSFSGYRKLQLNWHKGSINSFDILSDSRLIISTSQDGSLIVWDASTGEGLIKQFFFGENFSVWAYCTKEGEFNTSAGITNEIYWSDGLEVNDAIEEKSSMRNATLWKEIITPLLKKDSIDLEIKRVQEIYNNQNKELKDKILKMNKAKTRYTVKDTEGHSYPTVDINGDVWITENLETGLFNNGDSILEVKNLEEWKLAIDNKMPAYLIDRKNPELGKIYNGFAVTDPRGIAPEGMMLPGAKTFDNWNSIHSSYLRLTEFIPDEIFLGKFVNSNGYNADCSKSESTFIWSSQESDSAYFSSINSHGVWWFLNNSELSFCLSRCTGMDGEYFMGYGLDYADTSGSYGHGFYVRCVAPVKRFHNIKLAMESGEKVRYFGIYNKKVVSDSLYNLKDLEYLNLSSCDLSEIDIHFNSWANLKYLDLSGTNLVSLNHSIKDLTKLEYLDLGDCENLETDFNLLKELTSCKYIKIKDAYSHNFRENIIKLRETLANCIIDTSF